MKRSDRGIEKTADKERSNSDDYAWGVIQRVIFLNPHTFLDPFLMTKASSSHRRSTGKKHRPDLSETINQAESLLAEGKREEAIAIYRQWLKSTASPVDWAAQFNLGILLKAAGDFAGAEAAYLASLRQKPDFVQARIDLGAVRELLGRPEEAVKDWQAAVQDLKRTAVADPTLLGIALGHLERLGAAAEPVAAPDAPSHKKYCNYCQGEVERFLPYRGGWRNQPHAMVSLDVIGSDPDNFACPHCACTDRERHLKLYCTVLDVLKKDARILHFAPEWGFVSHIAQFDPEVHVFADPYSQDLRFEKINIEKIPYSDASFDYVIANHVMEHVADPDAALVEISRVLKADGIAILQTPYSSVLHKTFEDPGIDTDALRLEFYGQEDHVRLFGRDIFERFSAHLDPLVASHDSLFDSTVATVLGVNAKEPFFLFRKKALTDVPAPAGRRPARRTRSKKPLVSVVCITYNHAPLIRDALDSFLHQETDFDYEVLIGEDCSTDATRQVIEEFSSNQRCTLRPFFNEKNLGANRNFINLISQAKGKYIALCEGDDYWADRQKLQKQVDYLESNPDVAIVYSTVNSHRHGQMPRLDYSYVGGNRRDLTVDELKQAPPINSLTVMFRNLIQPIPPEHYTTGAGDMFLWSLIGWHGRGHYLDSVLPSIHRQHSGGIFTGESREGRWILDLMTSYSLFLYYRRIGESGLADYYANRTFLWAREIASCKKDEVVDRLLALPSKMNEMAAGAYAFDGESLSNIIRVAIADPKATPVK
ncbi:MAG: glycosyltransferase [Rhodocyclaceae bacterium]|nr:glycosyltransferase [Rhodocyclaceae bacterium]